MTIFDFKDFEDKSKQDIFEFLVASGDTAFTLIAHKYARDTRKAVDDPVIKTSEYYTNVYVGYELFKVADTFESFIPDPESPETIQFFVTVSDLILFTEYLNYCINGEFYFKIPHPENGLGFEENRNRFMDEIHDYDYNSYNAFAAVIGIWELFNVWVEKH